MPVGKAGTPVKASATPLSAVQAWRLAHFGSFDNTGAAADNADPDGDGTLNKTEFRLGLDPKSGNSVFKATGNHTPADFVLTWPSASAPLHSNHHRYECRIKLLKMPLTKFSNSLPV